MLPVLGGEVVEGQQLVEVVGDLRGGFGELRPVGGLERCRGVEGVGPVLGVPDLGQRLLRPRMRRFRQRPEHVGDLVHLMPTSA
jgi:hypothetical protein